MLLREQKYIEGWERKQSRGKWQYIILTSIFWGLLIPFVVKLFALALAGNIWSWPAWRSVFVTKDYLLFCAYFLLALFAYALIMWQLALQKYKQLKRKQHDEEKQLRQYQRH